MRDSTVYTEARPTPKLIAAVTEAVDERDGVRHLRRSGGEFAPPSRALVGTRDDAENNAARTTRGDLDGRSAMTNDNFKESEIEVEIVDRFQPADNIVHLSLRTVSGDEFPVWEPGAHIDVFLGDMVRQYSLCGDNSNRRVLDIAVLREPAGRGGSEAAHRLAVGDRVLVRGPRNNFPLVDAPEYVFVAGGIGITPILPMLRRAAESATPWKLIYGGRSRSTMAFGEDLQRRYGDKVLIRPQDEVGLIDLAEDLGPPRDSVAVYCCGPEPLLQAVELYCRNWPMGSLHLERFSARPQEHQKDASAFDVELSKSAKILSVPADQSVLDVLLAAGVEVPYSCTEGTCGTCETAVLAGEPEHRDSLLTEEERAANDVMFVCVSRSRTPRLTLDL